MAEILVFRAIASHPSDFNLELSRTTLYHLRLLTKGCFVRTIPLPLLAFQRYQNPPVNLNLRIQNVQDSFPDVGKMKLAPVKIGCFETKHFHIFFLFICSSSSSSRSEGSFVSKSKSRSRGPSRSRSKSQRRHGHKRHRRSDGKGRKSHKRRKQ